LDAFGRRSDIMLHPELSHGAVDFVATAEYIEGELHAPLCLFAFDVSLNSLSSGMLHAAINSISTILNSGAFPSSVRIGFLTYDTTIHFYNLHVGDYLYPSCTNLYSYSLLFYKPK
jgi:protein transport protein SEC24